MSSMTYFLGFLGLLQAVILPGLCLSASFRSWNWLQRFLFAPPLSLLLNYYLVWLLVSLGFYNSTAMLFIAGAEIGLILYRIKYSPTAKIAYPPISRLSEFLFLILAVVALTKYSQAWVRNFGDVFQMWDAIVSWNAWGRTWFEGSVPGSELYPHALPISFSLPYAFMGRADFETFSKASMGMVYLIGLGALLELGFRRRDIRNLAWACAYFYPVIQSRFLHSHWNSGYADVPLALMLLFAFCVSFLEGKEAPKVFGLIAGTAPLVKQPGLLFAAVSSLLFRGPKEIRRSFWPVALTATVAAGPWYLYIGTKILSGRSGHNTSFLANLVSGGLLTRWGAALNLILHFASPAYLFIGLAFAALGSMVSREARRWFLFLGLPYFLVWSIFFAYDIRNLSMALFPFAVAFSAGIVFLCEIAERRISALRQQIVGWRYITEARVLGRFVVGLTILLSIAAFYKPLKHWKQYGSALAWENEQRVYLGDAPQANRKFLDIAKCPGSSGAILLTNYLMAMEIPPLKGAIQLVDCLWINEAIQRNERALVYMATALCQARPKDELFFHQEKEFAIFATHPDLKAVCANR